MTSLEGFRSSIVVSLRLQIKVGTSLLTVLYFPNSEKTPITAESDIAGTRKRAFNEAAAAIIRGVASLREHARKLEEIARDRLQQPRRETVQTTRDNNRGYSR